MSGHKEHKGARREEKALPGPHSLWGMRSSLSLSLSLQEGISWLMNSNLMVQVRLR